MTWKLAELLGAFYFNFRKIDASRSGGKIKEIGPAADPRGEWKVEGGADEEEDYAHLIEGILYFTSGFLLKSVSTGSSNHSFVVHIKR